jgi:TRAP-type transport system periplasmic protein
MRLRYLLSILLLLCMLDARAAETYVFKFATLAPAGSTWMNIIDDWARQVEKDSRGRLTFKMYPGGVAGDETDVLQKIRFGQFHGGAFTGYGIGHVYSRARVLEMPFLFRNTAEIDHVRRHFMPEIESGFRSSGFELLGWMETGFIRFFSRTPIRNLDDLRQHRIWLWQGDPLGQAFFDATKIAPGAAVDHRCLHQPVHRDDRYGLQHAARVHCHAVVQQDRLRHRYSHGERHWCVDCYAEILQQPAEGSATAAEIHRTRRR